MARSRARRRRLIALLGLLVALAGVERGGHWLRSRYLLPTHGAEWIWARGSAETSAPVVFYAVRDFEVASSAPSARLRILGDEEYVLFLNGKRVGSGSFTPGFPLDEYEVGAGLRPGWNRLLVELRSSNGAGGLLASLSIGGRSTPALKSDGSWQLFRRHLPGLLEGWRPLDRGEPPQVWQSPPTGRWGVPRGGRPRATLAQMLVRRPETVAARSLERLPARYCSRRCDEPLHRLAVGLGGPGYLIDFGRPVLGYLELDLRGEAPFARRLRSGLGLEALGAGAGEEEGGEGEGTLLLMPGRRGWRDTRVRRLRYALVSGEGELYAARLHPVEPTAAAPRIAAERGRSRLLGIGPPQNSVTGSNSTTSRRAPSRKR